MKTLIFIVMAIFLMGGCASKEATITLLPDQDGKVGVITLEDKDGKEHRIDSAYETLSVSSKNEVEIQKGTREGIDQKYSELLQAIPSAPLHFQLFFDSGSAELDGNQTLSLQEIVATIQKNNPIKIVCIGHSDSTGKPEFNEKLSLQRAQNVATILQKYGITPELLTLEYYGDADPLVKTNKNESHPKNRRVEIIVK